MRIPTILLVLFGLTACAIQPRQGPPAPVVHATPRSQAEVPPQQQPQEGEQPSDQEGVQTYPYQDPSRSPMAWTPPVAAGTSVTAGGPGQGTTAPSQDGTSAFALPSQFASTPSATTPATQPRAPAQGQAPSPVQTTPSRPVTGPVSPALPRAETGMSTTAPAPQTTQVAVARPSSVAAPQLPDAASTLSRQAEQQRQSGDYASAAASLERALRISPTEPYLWNRLARVRLEQGQAALAGNLASRSNNLAGSNSALKSDNWQIIAEARQRTGDAAGAQEALRRANGG